MIWPNCGAANCAADATWVDSCGVGFCEDHQDDSLTGGLRLAGFLSDFDPEWLADSQVIDVEGVVVGGGERC